MSGLAFQADPQYVEILERENLLQQRLRLRSTFAVTGDGETREAPLQICFFVFLEGNLNSCAIWSYNLPYTAFRLFLLSQAVEVRL